LSRDLQNLYHKNVQGRGDTQIMDINNTIVMKFGGASVASPAHFSRIADIIVHRMQEFRNIIVVVSAMGETTNQLIELAKQVHPNPPKREYDMLVSVGERISISLLAMALAKKDKEAISFTGSQSGIITDDAHSEARIVEVRPHRLVSCLDIGKVVIVAGFQGVSLKGEITTLGRGGSDTSAVALGVAFGAMVEFYKDVPGIYSEDPKKHSHAYLYPALDYQEALSIVEKGAKVLHPRSLVLAAQNALPLRVLSFQEFNSATNQGTYIFKKGEKRPEVPVYEK
jgi:aspartate kinase